MQPLRVRLILFLTFIVSAALMLAPVAAQDNTLRVVSNFDIRTADPHVAGAQLAV